MISPAQLATADDGKRIILYPLDLTIRDLFAMAAMQGIVSTGKGQAVVERIATDAYLMADAMLAERAKNDQ